MSSKIAFIGLGVMGEPMASHLLAAGHQLVVCTRTSAKAKRLTHRGATLVSTPAEAARMSDFIFICVPDTPDVEKVILGEKGIVETIQPGTVVIDHSTISPTRTKELATVIFHKQASLLDAPVSGGDLGAKNATLSIMVGGDAKAFAKAEPLLRHLGKTVLHCGGSGSGQLTKLVNQILVSVTNLAVCEALSFARKHSLNMDKTIEALAGGAGGSWQLANLGPRMVKGDFRPGFTIDLQQKDLRLVLESAEDGNLSLPAASLVHQLFSAAQAAGHGKDGTQALFAVLEKLSSLH